MTHFCYSTIHCLILHSLLLKKNFLRHWCSRFDLIHEIRIQHAYTVFPHYARVRYTKFQLYEIWSVLYFIIRKFLITTNFSLQNFHVSYRGCSIHLKIFMSITSDVAFLLFFCSWFGHYAYVDAHLLLARSFWIVNNVCACGTVDSKLCITVNIRGNLNHGFQ